MNESSTAGDMFYLVGKPGKSESPEAKVGNKYLN